MFGDPEFRRDFCQKFSWTSVKTLVIEPVGPDGWSRRENRPIFKVKQAPEKLKPLFADFSCSIILAVEPVGLDGQIGPFSRSKEPRAGRPLRHLLLSHLVPTGKPTDLKCQTSPEQVNPSLCQNFMCYSPWIFVDLEFLNDFCQIFSFTSVKTLAIELVGPDGQTGPLSRSNKP
ncbi:hypothetical protein H5410_042198 [Solanum commersonii]|uniref:Uncharacterized protein n=1 Tax=Solanum commersonii TaxID=4109 RepID=A0A9J5XWW1_SOLCO|nr:hypothetical protein H5410_042198 [Solanum commersonii]